MTALNKQALRQAAEKATAGQWVVELGDEVYAVDGDDSEQIAMMFSDNGRSDAAFIAAASPVAVLSLLDENLQLQRDKDSLEAVAIAMRDDMREAREKLEAAEKRNAEAYAGWGNCQLTMGVYCHAYEEAKTHIAELIHNHRVHAARLIDERIVLKERIAELEAKLANPVLLPKTNGYWTEQEKAYEEAITLAKRQVRLAGFRCEGDE